MIRIHRPRRIPAILRTKGMLAKQQDRAAYAASPTAYASGAKTFAFDRGIYGHESVKQALCDAQHGKCCFCESPVTHVASGDVEHFRPKAAVAQDDAGPLTRPGYFWLAYEWKNLLFCCENCNRRHKRSLFPLHNPARRATLPSHQLRRERPLFVDPAAEEPSRHVGFRAEEAVACEGSREGQATIEALGLNRPALVKARLIWLEWIKAVRESYELLTIRKAKGTASDQEQVHLQVIEAKLSWCQTDPAPYAAMVRAFLAS
jgi:uncharacterized protein (TIGR02646 family)